jgi:hypothetical protein
MKTQDEQLRDITRSITNSMRDNMQPIFTDEWVKFSSSHGFNFKLDIIPEIAFNAWNEYGDQRWKSYLISNNDYGSY